MGFFSGGFKKLVGSAIGGAIGGPFGASIGGSLAGGLGGGGGGRGVTSGGEMITRFSPFSAGGINTGVTRTIDPYSGQAVPKLTVTSSPERQAVIDAMVKSYMDQAGKITGTFDPAMQGVFGQQLNELAAQRELVKPGYGALTKARRDEIQGARDVAIGNLRENLARRRVLGSSFAQDAQIRGESEFAKMQAESAARSFLEELDATQKFIDAQYKTGLAKVQSNMDMFMQSELAKRSGNETKIQEMDKLASIAQQFSGMLQNALNASSQYNASLAAQSAGGSGFLSGLTGGLMGGQLDLNGIPMAGIQGPEAWRSGVNVPVASLGGNAGILPGEWRSGVNTPIIGGVIGKGLVNNIPSLFGQGSIFSGLAG